MSKMGLRLRELASATRDGKDAGSRNLGSSLQYFSVIALILGDAHDMKLTLNYQIRTLIQGGPCGPGIDYVVICRMKSSVLVYGTFTVVELVILCQRNLVHDHMDHPVSHIHAQIDEDIAGEEYADSPLDAITLGVLEARSFLFKYDEDDDDEENKENDKKKKKPGLQRSQGGNSIA